MTPAASVGTRLSAALAAVLLGAFAIAYLIVVPSFERALVNSKLAALEHNADLVAADVRGQPETLWQETVDSAGATFNARAIVYAYDPGGGLLTDFADSHPGSAADMAHDEIAARAGASGRRVRGAVTRGEARWAEVAVPLRERSAVVLLSAPLGDTLASVDLARRRLLVAAGISFGFSLLLGYSGARAFARRLRRLEQAAERIAGGEFDEPVVDAGGDEVGQLARAFERMRLRLAQLDRARSEFIANASHELRTPLFSLGGFLELLDDEDLDDATRREFVARMREQLDRLTKLASDLLDLSRLDAGRLGVERERVDLGALAALLADEVRAQADRAEHTLEVASGVDAVALGDEQRVLQIGRIFLDNALRHTPAGTRVRVLAQRLGGTAVLAVEDDGPGIPAANAGQVFERFFRLDRSVAAGSGLGLAIGRELAELMGGRIELTATEGRTTFSLVLSAADAPAGVST